MFFCSRRQRNLATVKANPAISVPDDHAAPPVFCYHVSLFDADNVAELDGFDLMVFFLGRRIQVSSSTSSAKRT